MTIVLNIVVAVVGIIALALFVGSVYELRKIRNERTNHSVQWTNTFTNLQGRIGEVERRLSELSEIMEYVRLTFTLSVAFIRPAPTKLLLVKLARGEFEGFWGFPAGYVEPSNTHQWENPKVKADYEIERYLGHLRPELEYVGSPTDDKDQHLEINYGGATPVQVRVYEYILKSLETITDPTVQIVDFGQLEGIEPLNPLVYDVLQHYTTEVFSDDFRAKMGQIKRAKPSIIVSLQEVADLTEVDVTTGE